MRSVENKGKNLVGFGRRVAFGGDGKSDRGGCATRNCQRAATGAVGIFIEGCTLVGGGSDIAA